MEDRLFKCKEILEKYGQSHLFGFYENLNNEEKENLLCQIESIDFDNIQNLYFLTKKGADFKEDVIEKIDSIEKENLEIDVLNKEAKIGEEIIKSGKLAVVTMAGGQGTRLRTYWT